MSADDSADPGRQRTVAELLAEHGGGNAGGSRRRRRAAPDDDEPASNPTRPTKTGGSAVEASGGLSREKRAQDTSSTRARRSTVPADSQPAANGHQDPPQVPEQRLSGVTGYGQSIDPLTGDPIDPPSGQTFGVAPRGTGSATGSYRSIPLTRTDPPTEELPQYPQSGWASRAKDPGPTTGPMGGPATGGGPLTGQVSRADLFDDDDDRDDDDDDELDVDDELDDELEDEPWGRRASAAPAGLAERGERGELDDEEYEVEERPAGVVGWLGLIAQWMIGAVAGALLWVGFSYLWMNHQIIALVASLATTIVLVMLVRAIRRSDDLRTIMLAILVGLVVTISPAVLLLAVR
jgi:hypothetical protein